MPLSRWQRIIAAANELQPDMHLLMGDYVAGHYFRTGTVPVAQIAKVATELRSPMGTFGICGNHDWWEDRTVQKTRQGPTISEKTFTAVGIPMLENKALRLEKDGMPFWLTGTSSMVAYRTKRRGRFISAGNR
jgi:predicted MPP superfamily phosphohydrolase